MLRVMFHSWAAVPIRENVSAAWTGSAATSRTSAATSGAMPWANAWLASSSVPETTAALVAIPAVAHASANGPPCEHPTTLRPDRPRSRDSCATSSAQSVKVRPGWGSDAPRPGRSTEMSRTLRSSTIPPPNPSQRLVAAPGHSSTGTPSCGPHSAQPSCRPSARRVRPSREGSMTSSLMVRIVASGTWAVVSRSVV